MVRSLADSLADAGLRFSQASHFLQILGILRTQRVTQLLIPGWT